MFYVINNATIHTIVSTNKRNVVTISEEVRKSTDEGITVFRVRDGSLFPLA